MNSTIQDTTLTAEAVEAFNDKGYHIEYDLFSNEEVEELRTACMEVCDGIYETGIAPDERYWNPGDDPVAMHKIDNCWKSNDTVKRYVTDRRIGHICAQLLGVPNIRLWHDQLSHKPANGGKVATWHQDWAYWQMIRDCKTVSCWIALNDVTPDSGPMVYLEGSHRLGLYEHPDVVSGDDEMRPVLPEASDLREVPVIIPAGSVAFHHGLLLHGSGKNWSAHDRGAIVSHVMWGDSVYREKNIHICESAMRGYNVYPKDGETFRGPQFPLMYP